MIIINRNVNCFDCDLIVKGYDNATKTITYTLLRHGASRGPLRGHWSIDLDGYDLSTDAESRPTDYETWATLWAEIPNIFHQ